MFLFHKTVFYFALFDWTCPTTTTTTTTMDNQVEFEGKFIQAVDRQTLLFATAIEGEFKHVVLYFDETLRSFRNVQKILKNTELGAVYSFSELSDKTATLPGTHFNSRWFSIFFLCGTFRIERCARVTTGSDPKPCPRLCLQDTFRDNLL